LFIFIFTLLGTQIFGGSFKFNVYPNDPQRYNFDTFQGAFFTVFTILTVENWNGVLKNCLRSSANSILTVIYLIIWIIIGNYIFVNLFLSILLDGFESTDVMQQIEEIENESKELEMIHKNLVEKNEKKKIVDQAEKEKAIEQVLLIIDPIKYQSKQKIKKNQAVYLVNREDELDNASLSEDLNMEKICKKLQQGKKEKKNPYEGVDCVKSLYYFTQTNPIRLFCAKVCSHPW
jgi:superfamily I DNA and/or RNA helicase